MFRTLFFSIWFAFHPVHVTLTSIDYVAGNDVFKVFVRMYFDDFLLDCKRSGTAVGEKGFSGENSDSREAVENYLSENIVLKVNDKQLSPTLQDLKLADNEMSMNLFYRIDKKPKILTVKNLIMTRLYTDQSNMIIVRVNDFEEGIKLTSELTEQTFKLN